MSSDEVIWQKKVLRILKMSMIQNHAYQFFKMFEYYAFALFVYVALTLMQTKIIYNLLGLEQIFPNIPVKNIFRHF